jgi:hypothetical protein
MKPEEILFELLDRVAALECASPLIRAEELLLWPYEAVVALKAQKLIRKAKHATSVVCPGCERECVMPVHTVAGKSGDVDSFIICDKRSDINRVPVSPKQLTQWRCTMENVCRFVSDQLGLQHGNQKANDAGLWEIGVVRGNKRSQMICLQTNGCLSLVAGNSAIPLAEFIGYRDNTYSLDTIAIGQMVDNATTADERYTPTTARREVRKQDTQDKYERWRKAYRTLKKANPDKSDKWCSIRISKMDIAGGAEPETIRKQMKK